MFYSLAAQAKLLHGEQYLSIKKPIPTSGTLVSTARLLEVLDKGKAAAVTSITETRDKATGDLVFENTSTVFIRGSGGFGGKTNGKGASRDLWDSMDVVLMEWFWVGWDFEDRGPATAANKPPTRKPDAIVEEKTSPTQAALYRYVQISFRSVRASGLITVRFSLSGDYNPLHVSLLTPQAALVSSMELTRARSK